MIDLRQALEGALELNRALRKETLDDLVEAVEEWHSKECLRFPCECEDCPWPREL